MKLLTRDQFKELVFKRDQHKCVICYKEAIDAHHITERKLFEDGGYYLDNGSSLCSDCHIKAENTTITPQQLRNAIGIKSIVLPKNLDPDKIYDKWGNVMTYIKYPRTPHLPWSESLDDDDFVIEDVDALFENEIVMTEKMDGENTTCSVVRRSLPRIQRLGEISSWSNKTQDSRRMAHMRRKSFR
jgi:hypothetical protein